MGRKKCFVIWIRRIWIRNQTLKHSDFQFKVSISKNVESLNISNTVAIVCHHINHILKKNSLE